MHGGGFAVRWLRHTSARRMTPQSKPRFQRPLVAGVVAFAILLLLLRLFVFTHGHGRRGALLLPPTEC